MELWGRHCGGQKSPNTLGETQARGTFLTKACLVKGLSLPFTNFVSASLPCRVFQSPFLVQSIETPFKLDYFENLREQYVWTFLKWSCNSSYYPTTAVALRG